MSCLRLGSLFGIFGITKFRICSSRNSIGSEISNHVAGMNRNAESLRRLGDLHEAWVFRCPKGRTPPGGTTPRQWGRTPGCKGTCPPLGQGRLQRDPAAQSRLRVGTAFYSSFKLLCHGAPPPTAVSRSSVARESADPRAGDYSGRAPALHCAAAS